MTNLSSFENRVRDRRMQSGWSQEELARRSGLSRTGISAIETGRIIPSAAAALGLAAALGCRVRGAAVPRRVARLPGYDSVETGDLQQVS
jgi:transcriptional regulator with XRE-family HTH domain